MKYKTSIILIIILFLSYICTNYAQEQLSDTIVAIVNDDIITYGEVVSKIKESLQGIENSNLSKAQKEYQKQRLIKITIRRLIDEKLILQEAKKYNIKISKESIKEQIEKEFKSKGRKAVEGGEVNLTELMRMRMTLQKLFQKKSGYSRKEKRRATIDTFVSPQEIRYYYKIHLNEFTKEPKIKTRIITLFYSKNGGRTQTLNKAKAIVKELREGADFGEMAKLYSNDPYAKDGGKWPRIEKDGKTVWDFFGKGEALFEEVEDIAFSMKKGEISDPIPVDSQLYCQIIKIEDIKPGGIIPFSKAQGMIRQKLRYEKIIEALERMKLKLREKAFIWPPDIFKEDNIK